MLKRYRLADASFTVPMPDRAGRLFSQAPEGETVDTEDAFYRALIVDGDIVEADDANTEQPAAPRGKSKGN